MFSNAVILEMHANTVLEDCVEFVRCTCCWAEAGQDHIQTLVPIAANGGKDPEEIDAAAYTFLH